jgi:hypothetical protein
LPVIASIAAVDLLRSLLDLLGGIENRMICLFPQALGELDAIASPTGIQGLLNV